MKKYFLILALFASACITSLAGTKKKSKKDKKAEVAKVDTIDVKTFSYLIGRLTTEGLAQYIQQQGVDLQYMSYFLEGFKQGQLSETDAQAKARITGAEIRQDVDTRVIPNLAKQINDSTTQLSSEEFVRGFMEAMQGVQSEISTDSAKILVDKQMEYYQTTQMERRYGANRKAGEDFLKANAKNKDITQTASGLQYKVITKGEGPVPTATQKVKVHYEGKLLDGKVFDSSYKRGQPTTFGVNQVIKGWIEALTLMPVGSKWEIYIPQELAYGARDQREIPPFSCLIFTVELLEIVP